MIKMDWLADGVAQRVVGAVFLALYWSFTSALGVQYGQSSSQWETVDYLKKYPKPC
jgi:hypothetical protein